MTVVDDAPGQVAEQASPLDRSAHVRSVLRHAEESTGLRRASTLLSSAPVAPAHRVAPPDERLLPVHETLSSVMPFGGLQRGTAVAVQGSTGLLLVLVAEASRNGAWTAMVGFPGIGVVAAADAGMDLDRLALVPRPGPDAAAAIAALVDGIDIVVVGPGAGLLDADRRRLLVRARERGAVVISVGPWPGAHVVLTARAGAWSGTDHGAGWLRRRTVVVERAGRAGASRQVQVEIELLLDRAPRPAYLADVPSVERPVERPPLRDLRLVG